MSMALDRQIEASQPISRKRVCSSLEKDGFGSKILHDFADNPLKDMPKGLII